jgi:serine phosphatase RsbU (regulator of sigma subunit)
MLEVCLAVAKTHKYASRESGDTVELIERPHGGVSLFLVDAQGSGLAAKTISNLVTSRGAALVKEGTRDGAVARALHDYLYTLRHGRVLATLNIVSVDLRSRTLVLSRNDECPAYFFSKEGIEVCDEECRPIGIYARTKPAIVERMIGPYLGVVVTSDGVVHAGKRQGAPFDVRAFLEDCLEEGWPEAQSLADALLSEAVALEDGRPGDDVSVIVVTIVPAEDSEVPVRWLSGSLPIEGS